MSNDTQPSSSITSEAKETNHQPTIMKKSLLMSAGFYPMATGIMQMGKGMSANPALVTMAMIVLLAITRSILSQQMSAKKTVNSLRATPIKAYQSYFFDLVPRPIRCHSKDYLLNIRRQKTREFVDNNSILRENKIASDSLFETIKNYQTNDNNIFYTIENNKIDNEPDDTILGDARKIYQIKSALITIDFTKDFPDCNKLTALEKVITMIQGSLQEEKGSASSTSVSNEKPSINALISAIKTMDNANIRERLNKFLSGFKTYIHGLAESIPPDKAKKDKEKIVTQLYQCVLVPELEENNRLIRSRSETIFYSLLPRIIFLAVLIGNTSTFTIFTQQKGEVIVKYLLQLLDHHVLGISTFFSATPAIVISIVVALVFSLSTWIICWYFGGNCVKSTLDKIGQELQRLFKVDNTITRAYNKGKPKDTFWMLLLLGCFVAFGSNMVLFNYIRTGDTFTKKIPIGKTGQFFLMISIFITTTCLFLVLFNELRKEHIPLIKNRCLYVMDGNETIVKDSDGNNKKRSLLFIGLNIFALLSITANLCYVLVVSDISKAPNVFKGYNMHNKWAILISIIGVGVFSAVFNIIYASKALDYIHKKVVALWEKATPTDKILMVLSLIMLSATMIFISLPSSLGSLGFSLVASSAVCILIISFILSKPILSHIKEEKASEKITLLMKNSFIFGLSCVLLSEAILINQNLLGENIATHTYDWSLHITAIVLCAFALFKALNYIHKKGVALWNKDTSSELSNASDSTNPSIKSIPN